MALTGELTDLSLAELIEFFCNQRKTGQLAVAYPQGSAYFYLQAGAVVHASIGTLRAVIAWTVHNPRGPAPWGHRSPIPSAPAPPMGAATCADVALRS